jgi:hypothetical protein
MVISLMIVRLLVMEVIVRMLVGAGNSDDDGSDGDDDGSDGDYDVDVAGTDTGDCWCWRRCL